MTEGMNTDVRIIRAEATFRDARARQPLKFGAAVLEGALYCQVEAEVETRRGAHGVGHGGMLLSDFWAFPDPNVEHALREQAMAELARRLCELASAHAGWGHPVDLCLELEEDLARLSAGVTEALSLPVPLPRLATLVAASPLDCALHDAYGVANGLCTYDAYGPEHMRHDLSRYLGPAYRGKHIRDYIRAQTPASIEAFHLVGGLDTLRENDVRPDAPHDGLPNSLEGWIERDGLTCLKVKLRGTDLAWDLDRLAQVHDVARGVHARLGIDDLCLTADTNEQCEDPGYVVELLTRLRERNADAFRRILYVEQPTERDMRRRRHDMAAVAALKPVLIDESLTSLEDLELALELNWSGVALKSCKGHTWSLLFASLARERGIPYAIQDLSNPGVSLVHSAALAGRLHGMRGVEANSCQYFPEANTEAAKVHRGVFRRRDGRIRLDSIRGSGLGLRWDEIAAVER